MYVCISIFIERGSAQEQSSWSGLPSLSHKINKNFRNLKVINEGTRYGVYLSLYFNVKLKYSKLNTFSKSMLTIEAKTNPQQVVPRSSTTKGYWLPTTCQHYNSFIFKQFCIHSNIKYNEK